MHVLLIAPPGRGKSGPLRRIARTTGKPLFGYETIKEDALAEDGKGSPIYIYELGSPRTRNEHNLAGYCLNHHAVVFPEAFDRFAAKLRRPVPADHLICLDELGPMESRSPAFCDAVLALLDGPIPVLAAVRDKDTPFLQSVRSHPGCRCFPLSDSAPDRIIREAAACLQEAIR